MLNRGKPRRGNVSWNEDTESLNTHCRVKEASLKSLQSVIPTVGLPENYGGRKKINSSQGLELGESVTRWSTEASGKLFCVVLQWWTHGIVVKPHRRWGWGTAQRRSTCCVSVRSRVWINGTHVKPDAAARL